MDYARAQARLTVAPGLAAQYCPVLTQCLANADKVENDMSRKIEDPILTQLDSRDIDSVMRLNTNLLSEIWLLRDRLAVVERLLADKAIVGRGEVDTFKPDPEMDKELEHMRAQFIERALQSASNTAYSVQSLVASANAR